MHLYRCTDKSREQSINACLLFWNTQAYPIVHFFQTEPISDLWNSCIENPASDTTGAGGCYLSLLKEGGAPFWTWEGLGACQGHDLLDRQAQLQPMRRVADADLTLDLRVTGQT